MRNLKAVLLSAFFLFSLTIARADSYKPVVDEQYTGGFKDDFPVVLSRVKTLAPLAQQDIATKLGLTQPSSVFIHPVIIRFEDGLPATHENPFFGIASGVSDQPGSQQLIVNMEAFARHRDDVSRSDHEVRNAFNYAITELIVIDLTGGPLTSDVPPWVREGLGIYFSDQGPQLIKDLAGNVPKSRVHELLGDLNLTPNYLTRKNYAQYYLAIQFIADTHGVDTLQQFVRDIIGGKSPAEAVLDSLSEEWPAFEKDVRAYSEKTLGALAPYDTDPRFQNGSAASSSSSEE